MTPPLHSYNDDYRQPNDPLYRLKARNGYFLGEQTPLWHAVIKAAPPRKPNRLRECKEQATLTITNKVPREQIAEAVSFFGTVNRHHGTEALLLVYYNPQTKEYRFLAPPQHVTPGSVRYDAIGAPDGYLEIGSFHSHPGSAFHSPTDIADEQKNDGLHFVFGHVHRAQPDIVGILSVRGKRFPINPYDVIEPPWEYDGPWLEHLNPHGGKS